MNRKQVENVAKKKLDSLMKESKIRDREDPDSFTIAALPPSAKRDEKTAMKVRELRLHMAFILLFLSGSLCFNNSSSTSKSPCCHKKKSQTLLNGRLQKITFMLEQGMSPLFSSLGIY